MRRGWFFSVCLALNACVPIEATDNAPVIAEETASLPAMRTFAAASVPGPYVSNTDLARDFLDLSFALENGQRLDVFTRFEGPISVAVTGDAPASLLTDLGSLITRLQREARINILQVSGPANITIEAVQRREIRRILPSAACFVVPNVSSLREYRGARRSSRTDWTQLTERRRIAVFVPSDASPQEIRDCLHEELAQAIGPLNDLYRLTGSVFNDDDVHTVLTGYDMLILRIYYAPELRNGMSRNAVAARLPVILSRLNPGGGSGPSRLASDTPNEWRDAVQTALGPGTGAAGRKSAARKALSIATEEGWQDNRRAFSHFANGRILSRSDPDLARAHFEAAYQFYARLPGTELHRAFVATQLAAQAITEQDVARALSLIQPHIGTAQNSQNAALLSTLLLLQAEALDLMGQSEEAEAVRLDSLGWARYGFGPDWAVRAKVSEIGALNPQKG